MVLGFAGGRGPIWLSSEGTSLQLQHLTGEPCFEQALISPRVHQTLSPESLKNEDLKKQNSEAFNLLCTP